MNIRRFAAIDIGSNGIRLLISNVIEREGHPTLFRKCSLVRVPISLGRDVFVHQKIQNDNKERLIEAMKAYRSLMKVHQVEKYRACATSAMRESYNGKEVRDEVYKASGIEIDIIDGSNEARIIANNHLNSFIEDTKDYLYVDVGGGSTEFTVYKKGVVTASKSFKIGTVRLLNDIISDADWKRLQAWIQEKTKDSDGISLVGSGGNINKIFKVSRKKQTDPLTLSFLKKYYKILMTHSYEDRISLLELNPDRADVIIHATKIFLNAMKWSGAKHIYVPKIGLSDGIIKSLYTSED